jgi:hypothetical protein
MSNTDNFASGQGAAPTKSTGNPITADTFNQMINILDALAAHSHTFTDDYTDNCQCNCSRGSL